MRYKMIFGRMLFSFFRGGARDLRIREVRFLNRDQDGRVNGTTRLVYDEESATLQRYVNGSAPIASLSDDMVCFLAEVSRCFGRLSGESSWEDDVWLCVDAEVKPEKTAECHCRSGELGEPAGEYHVPALQPRLGNRQIQA